LLSLNKIRKDEKGLLKNHTRQLESRFYSKQLLLKKMQGVKCMNMHKNKIKEQSNLKRGFFWAVT
jgi:hypothetical protein